MSKFNGRRSVAKSLVGWVGVLMTLSAFGCMVKPMGVVDNVPAGAPKGHVQFYFVNHQQNPWFQCEIFSVVDGENDFEARTSSKDPGVSRDAKIGVQIAKPPGTYEFLVRMGSGDFPIRLEVEVDRVTPVQMKFVDVEGEHESETHFNMELVLEDSHPIAD